MIDADEQEDQLRDSLDAIRQASSPLRRANAISRLISQVQRLPGLIRSSHQDYPLALNTTWRWLFENIDRFYPEPDIPIQKALIGWVNGYLKWRIRDLYKPELAYSLDEKSRQNDDKRTRLDQELDNRPNPLEALLSQESSMFAQIVRDHIKQDRDGQLRQNHVRNLPQCNCQELIRRLLLSEPPERIAEVARFFNSPYTTVDSLWKRKCMPCLRQLSEHLRRYHEQ